MDVKEAVQVAREYVADLFDSEKISNVGLEEVAFDDAEGLWEITVGFSRPWERQGALGMDLGLKAQRAYKVVCISNSSGTVKSVKDRVLPTPQR